MCVSCDVRQQTTIHACDAILDHHQALVHVLSKLWENSCFLWALPRR
jgi:hypothetical protein